MKRMRPFITAYSAWVIACLVALLCLGRALGARSTLSVLLFPPTLEAVPEGGLDGSLLANQLDRKMREALQRAGYETLSFNPESPSIVRALERDRTLNAEDVAHPEREASARKIATLYGVRFVLFPSLTTAQVDLAERRARAEITVRLVPDLGPEQKISGVGAAERKGQKADRSLADRLCQEALNAAAGQVVKQLEKITGVASGGAELPEAASYFAQAQKSLAENRLDVAIALLERATQLDPRNAEYAVALGDAYQRSGRTANALLEYRRAVVLQPDNPDLRVRLARIYLQRSMLREASSELKRASYLAPDHPEMRSTLVEVYLRSNMLPEAVAECRRLAQTRPQDVGIRLDLGDLLLRSGLLDEAEAEYKTAATLDPQNPAPHERLAVLYQRRNRHREALQELLLAQRTPAGANDAQRYRAIAQALDKEASTLLTEAGKIAAQRKENALTREEAYTAVKSLAERAEALAATVLDLKAPSALAQSHQRRCFAYSLVVQCLLTYASFYESDSAQEGTHAAALQAQAVQEIEQAARDLGP